MSHPPSPSDDDPRDMHLLAALRHAPDRDVVPPAPVTAAILAHARQAALGPRKRDAGTAGGWRDVWARLWQPAPMAAFGTVAMATLIGVMWSGQDLPEPTPALRPESVAAAPGPESPRAASATPAATPPPPAAEGPAAQDKPTARAATEPARAPSLPQAAPRQAPSERRPRDSRASGKLAEPMAAAVRQPAVPQAPVAPARELARAAAAATPREPGSAVADARREAVAKAVGDTLNLSARGRSDQAAVGAAMPAAATPLAAANAEVELAMRGDPARVRWRIAADRLIAHEAVQRDWWSSLARATQGRWRSAATEAAGSAEAPALQLLVDGVVRGSLAFEAQAVVWRDVDGVAWRAPMTAETLREWQQVMARW